MSTESNKEILAQFIEDVWNRERLDDLQRFVAQAYTVFHDPGDPWHGRSLDHAGFTERVMQSRAAAPDQKFTIQDMVGENDKVATAWKWQGTHLGQIAGIPPTGNAITMSGLTLYYFDQKKLVGHWQVADRLSVYQQVSR